MTFTISNLKTGDLVICANGKMATVMKGTAREDVLRFHTEFNSFSRLGVNYNSDMTNKRADGLTIVKVYRAIGVANNKIGDLVFNPLKMLEYGTVVYDRATAEANGDDITIDSLKTGDMLVHRNCKRSTVFKGAEFGDIVRYHTANNSFTWLSKFDNDTLEHVSNSDYDIVEVYRTAVDDPTKYGDDYCNVDQMICEANKIYPVSTCDDEYGLDDTIAAMTYDDLQKFINHEIDSRGIR